MNNIAKIGMALNIRFRRVKSQGISNVFRDKSMILYPFRLLIHPLAAFSDLKYEKKASVLLANGIMLLYFIIRVIEATSTGYLFSAYRPDEINIAVIFAQTVGAALLWSICNWASCTLFDGEGTIREIWITTAYSFMPVVLLEPVIILASHILSLDETIIIGTIQTIALAWSLLLIFLGMMTVQQFTVKKTILLAIVTILSIVALCFLFLLFFSIVQQMAGFVSNIILELSYR